jgi:dipeptidyl aminopeptidase/acylaminoacyl peptidase
MASVLEDVDRNAAKFLIMHGNKDEDVSIEHSQLLYAKLLSTAPVAAVKNSTRVQFYTINGAAHMFGKPGEMDQAWAKICPFLREVLGEPTPVHTAANPQ